MTVEAELPDRERPDLMFLAEAPGDEELIKGRPLVGPSGRLLNFMLFRSGISRRQCLVDNVFQEKLPNNSLKPYTVTKAEFAKMHRPEVDPEVTQIGEQKTPESGYLDTAWWPALQRLRDTILEWQPKVVVPLGSTALWAMTGATSIAAARGAAMWGTLAPVKVLPTYHPAYIARKFSHHVIVVEDLNKAKREAEDPDHLDIQRRELWLNPTLGDLHDFYAKYIYPLCGGDVPLGCDIETSKGQIECIGFAPSNDRAIVVPFIDYDKNPPHYWSDVQSEVEAWQWCRDILETSDLPILGQNFMFDVQWLFWRYKMRVMNYSEDTRLQHHSLYPELPKDQAFLVSVYEREASWKHLGREDKQDG